MRQVSILQYIGEVWRARQGKDDSGCAARVCRVRRLAGRRLGTNLGENGEICNAFDDVDDSWDRGIIIRYVPRIRRRRQQRRLQSMFALIEHTGLERRVLHLHETLQLFIYVRTKKALFSTSRPRLSPDTLSVYETFNVFEPLFSSVSYSYFPALFHAPYARHTSPSHTVRHTADCKIVTLA